METAVGLNIIVTILVGAGIVGGAFSAYTRSQVRELREMVEFWQSQRQEEIEARRADQAECRQQIAELRGQIQAFESEAFQRFLESLREGVVAVVKETVREALPGSTD